MVSKNNCCVIITTFITILLGIFIITNIFIPLAKYNEFDEYECKVDKVIYPTKLPSTDNMVGWTPCNCGKYCSSYTPCIDIYVNINNSSKSYQAFNNFLTHNTKCTFYDHKCPKGEDILKTQSKLESAILLAKSYINKNIPMTRLRNFLLDGEKSSKTFFTIYEKITTADRTMPLLWVKVAKVEKIIIQ